MDSVVGSGVCHAKHKQRPCNSHNFKPYSRILAYTYIRTKIYDCFCIALGFVLRVYAGDAACSEPVSDWLFLTIIAMSLFMAFGKRRGEQLNVGGNETREVLRHYEINFLQGMLFVCAGLAVIFYSLWAMNRGSNMIYTVSPVRVYHWSAAGIYCLCRHRMSYGRLQADTPPKVSAISG